MKHDKPAYQLSGSRVLELYGSRAEGLPAGEAAKRLNKFGFNELQQINKEPLIYKLLRQFQDLMIILLLASAGISIYLQEYRTAAILFVIVIVNATIGFWQEHKAENIMASLEKLVVAKSRVMRDGSLIEIPTAQLVPGDVIYLAEGDSVPADARILTENIFSTNDFALTGESNPSRKFQHAIKGEVTLGRRHNLVFMGTTVATGDGHCVVIGTGMQTELGRIANLSQSTKQDLSPLQKEMNHLAATITKGTVILGAILALIAFKESLGIKESFVFAIGIASAMIPQGLPAEVSTALSSAANRLAKAKALVKKLSAVETLGSTSIILTDKTGTLTKNQMTVEQILIGGRALWVTGTGYQANGQICDQLHKPLKKSELGQYELFFATGVFASNAIIRPPDEQHGNWYTLGDPTEGSLITLAHKAGINDTELHTRYPEIYEFTFDSARKRMSSIRNYHGPKIFCKGAPDSVLAVCNRILDGNIIRKLTVKDRESIMARDSLLAQSAMRNLAYAYKETADEEKLTMAEAESDLIFLGLVSMIDPPRDEIPEAMAAAIKAHIPVCIVTGDNALTASAIAVKTGLAATAQDLRIITGEQLQTMENSQVISALTDGNVIFSRVAPEDKLRIVELAKSARKVVAVTGDGINDAPALKRADIGVAMGITGTDVAKQSADIILLDDSFHTLVSAIQEGRVIFQNIRKAAISALTSNSGELFTVLVSLAAFSLWDIPIAIPAVLILLIDLMAELFPIASLGWDPAYGELMDEQPRRQQDHILNWKRITDLALCGILMGGLAYANFLFFIERHGGQATHFDKHQPALYASAVTLTYLTIVTCQFANILIRRTHSFRRSLLSSYLWSNKHLLAAFLLSFAGILIIAYAPIAQNYLGSGPLGLTDWLLALGAAFIYIFGRWLINFKISLAD